MNKIIAKYTSLVLATLMLFGCLAFTGCSIFGGIDTPDGGKNPPTPPVERDKGYYFDSNANDGGDGTEEKPFNDLSVIADLSFDEGEDIFLKCGSYFKGRLELNGVSGKNRENLIVVTSYGDGDKPKIDGDGIEGKGVVHIENCSYVTVDGLEIFNSATTEGNRVGVYINATNSNAEYNDKTVAPTTFYNITVQNCYIHDIKGYLDVLNNGMSSESKRTGGIQIRSSDRNGRFDGVYILHNEIENVDNVGISSSGGRGHAYVSNFDELAFTNVEIAYNEVHNVGKNAIFMRSLYGGYIEHNVVYDTCMRCFTGNQIVTSQVYKTVIQYNEGYNNMARVNDTPGANSTSLMDGCMLDADLNSRDTIWQYNYSHDNSFGLFMNCTGNDRNDVNSKDNVIVRYNLSVCDKGNRGIIYVNYYANSLQIYNNTIITAEDTKYIIEANDDRTFHFFNNLIYNRSTNTATAGFKLGNMSKGTINNNLIYSENDLPIKNMSKFLSYPNTYNGDPLLVNKFFGSLEDRTGYDKALEFCRVMASSPALEEDIAVDVAGVFEDFLGNDYAPSFGCVNFPGKAKSTREED